MRILFLTIFLISGFANADIEYHDVLPSNGQCVEVGAGGVANDVVPDTEYSGLHSDPEFSGCYPRIYIDKEAYGLADKVTIIDQPLCEYVIWSDLGTNATAPYRCPPWN